MLSLVPLVADSGVCSAAWTPTRLVAGFASGLLRVYSRTDLVLEREVRVGRSEVSRVAGLPGTEIVAVICERQCSVHNLESRKLVVNVDSSSAKYVAGVPNVLVVGSSYKLRILHFRRGKFVSIAVVDTPDRTKVRAVGTMGAQVYTVIGTRLPKLWKVDLTGLGRLVPVMVLDPKNFGSAHKYVICGTGSSLIVGSSTAGLCVRMENPLQIIKQLPPLAGAGLVKSSPLDLELLAVLAPQIRLLNPATGSELARVDIPVQIVGAGGLAIHHEKVVALRADLTHEALTKLDRSEAAKLAFSLPPSEVTAEIRDLQRHEVAQLFHNGLVDEAMRLLLMIEEQEPEEGPFVNNEFASSLLLTYVISTDWGNLDPASSAANSLVSRQSTRTTATTDAATVHYHPLNAAVAYLTYTRRKLRLKGETNKQNLQNIDTLLFLCYLAMRSPLLTSLVRTSNFCDPHVVEPRLREAGKWRELVAFFRSRGDHRGALDLLVEHKEPPGVIANYLVAVPDLEMVFDYAKQILPSNPDLIERLFYDREQNNLQVYRFLREIMGEKCADEFALHAVDNGDKTPELHNQVALIWAERGLETTLTGFLESSAYIVPKVLLSNSAIPPGGQAILYKKLGEIRRAIDIYLEMGEKRIAQELAVTHGEAAYLFDKLLNSGVIQDTAEFLNTVDPSVDLELPDVLSKLQETFPIWEISDFLTKFTVAQSMRIEQSISLEAVSRRTLAEQSIKQAEQKHHRHKITGLDACAVCHKRLGRAMTAISHNKAMHYTCYKNQQNGSSH